MIFRFSYKNRDYFLATLKRKNRCHYNYMIMPTIHHITKNCNLCFHRLRIHCAFKIFLLLYTKKTSHDNNHFNAYIFQNNKKNKTKRDIVIIRYFIWALYVYLIYYSIRSS